MLNKEKFWSAKPYPHIIVDDYLPNHAYKDIAINLSNYNRRSRADKLRQDTLTFNTRLEKNKVAYARNSELGSILTVPRVYLAALGFLRRLEDLFSFERSSILSLEDIQTPFTEYRYFHQTEEGGSLGMHVDHSQLYDRYGKVVKPHMIHFANAIYYCGPNEHVGGQTFLTDGRGKTVYVEPKPNRLLIFLHSSNSWHGVRHLAGGGPRTTVYMDYYTYKSNIDGILNFSWRKHATTFKPGWKDIKYWWPYVKYLRGGVL